MHCDTTTHFDALGVDSGADEFLPENFSFAVAARDWIGFLLHDRTESDKFVHLLQDYKVLVLFRVL